METKEEVIKRIVMRDGEVTEEEYESSMKDPDDPDKLNEGYLTVLRAMEEYKRQALTLPNDTLDKIEQSILNKLRAVNYEERGSYEVKDAVRDAIQEFKTIEVKIIPTASATESYKFVMLDVSDGQKVKFT